jgi:hypothetical protein
MRPNRLQCGNTAAHTALLVVLPRDVLARPTNQEHEVDAAEEAKQVALYRYELTGELCDDDEIRSFYEDDIVNFDTEQREAITFKSWLQEYLLHGVFYEVDTVDAR